MTSRAVVRQKDTYLFKAEEIARVIFSTADRYVRVVSPNDSPVSLYKHYGIDLKWRFCEDSRTVYYWSPVDEFIVSINAFNEGLPV